MNLLSAKVKQDAKGLLKGQWGKAIAILFMLIGMGLFFILFEAILAIALHLVGNIDTYGGLVLNTTAEGVFYSLILTACIAFLTFLVMTPFWTGIQCWYYNLAQDNDNTLGTVFVFFSGAKLFFKALGLKILIFLRVFLLALAAIVPCAVVFWLGLQSSAYFTTSWESILFAIGMFSTVMIFLVSLIAIWLFSMRYSLAVYLICHNPDLKNREAIKYSVAYMKREKSSMLLFKLSFFPWALLCVLILPIFFVLPYYNTANALYGRFLIEQGEYRRIRGDCTIEFTSAHKNGGFSQPQTDIL